jgi:protein-S-isoprenylcysteine O-methyltransferase Ste14
MSLMTRYGLNKHIGAAYGTEDAGSRRKSAVERHRRLVQLVFWAAFATTLVMTRPSIENTYTHSLVDLVAYGLVTAATVGRLWCSLYVRGRKSKYLCQDGPYSVCRNPLYLFSFLGLTGVALASERLALIIVLPVLSSGYYLTLIRSEEKRLRALFGEEYEAYCARVPRIVPHVKGYSTPETVAVTVDHSLPGVIKAMGYLWMLFLVQLIETMAPVAWWVP